MLKKMLLCFALTVGLVPLSDAQSGSWDSLYRIAPLQDVQVIQKDSKSVKGQFSAYDSDSISVMKKGNIVVIARSLVKSVGIKGRSRRKHHILTGLAIGAGAGFILGAISTGNDNGGFEIVSDQAVITASAIMGAGVGAAAGALVPAHGYLIIYQAPE